MLSIRQIMQIFNADLNDTLCGERQSVVKKQLYAKAAVLTAVMLCMDGRPVRTIEIAARLGVSVEVIKSVLKAWVKAGILTARKMDVPRDERGGLYYAVCYGLRAEMLDTLPQMRLPDANVLVDSLGLANGLATQRCVDLRDRALEELKIDPELLRKHRNPDCRAARMRMIRWWRKHAPGVSLSQLSHTLGIAHGRAFSNLVSKSRNKATQEKACPANNPNETTCTETTSPSAPTATVHQHTSRSETACSPQSSSSRRSSARRTRSTT